MEKSGGLKVLIIELAQSKYYKLFSDKLDLAVKRFISLSYDEQCEFNCIQSYLLSRLERAPQNYENMLYADFERLESDIDSELLTTWITNKVFKANMKQIAMYHTFLLYNEERAWMRK
jgi:hypothetical protein